MPPTTNAPNLPVLPVPSGAPNPPAMTSPASGVGSCTGCFTALGVANQLAVSFSPSATIVADGTSTTHVTATVTDINSQPVIGDTVTFSTSGDVTFASTTDNGNGTYTATITASTTPGDETITGHDGSVSGTATLHELRASAFSGVVEDSLGHPVGNVSMNLNGSPGNFGQHTASDGSFSLIVPSGVYSLSLSENPSQSSLAAPVGVEGVQTFSFASSGVDLSSSSLMGQTIALPAQVSVSVAVTDVSNNPVVGAGVSMVNQAAACDTPAPQGMPGTLNQAQENLGLSAVTDAGGIARGSIFACTPANGEHTVIDVAPPSGSNLEQTEVTYTSPITTDTTIPVTLTAGAAFSGVVEDSLGHPVGNVSMNLNGSPGNFGQHTASDGSFSLIVPSGVYSLSLSENPSQSSLAAPVGVEGVQTFSFASSGVDLSSSSLMGQTIALPAQVSVSVAVTDVSNNPVVGAGVSMVNQAAACDTPAPQGMPGTLNQAQENLGLSAVTDAGGIARGSIFACTPANGEHTVIDVAPPSGSNLEQTEVTYTSPITTDTTIPVTLTAGAAFSGVVEDSLGHPVGNVSMNLNGSPGNFGQHTASDGSFSLIVPSGVYSLSLSENPSQSSLAAPVGVEGVQTFSFASSGVDLSSSSLMGQTIALPAQVSVSVAVTDVSNNPVVGAGVSMVNQAAACDTPAPQGMPGTLNQAQENLGLSAVTDAGGIARGSIFACTPANGEHTVIDVAPPSGSNLEQTEVTYTSPITTDTTIPVTLIPVTPPGTVPGAPTGVSGAAGNHQVRVSWSAPGSDGGSTITSYLVTAAPGGATCSWSSGPLSCVVTGLTNGTPYTFTVTATNMFGTGPPSAASLPVTPGTVPGAPTGVSGAAGNHQVRVSWSAPGSDGGSTITSYLVTAAPGGATCSWSSGPLSCVVTGLTNGTPYTFTVTATNMFGTGPPSAASLPVTPGTVPGAPTGVSGAAGNHQVRVSWSAPGSDGGSTITSYLVTAAPGGATCSWSSGPLSCVVTGLTNGTPYTFTVTATNMFGTGPRSAASRRVVPSGPVCVRSTQGHLMLRLPRTVSASGVALVAFPPLLPMRRRKNKTGRRSPWGFRGPNAVRLGLLLSAIGIAAVGLTACFPYTGPPPC